MSRKRRSTCRSACAAASASAASPAPPSWLPLRISALTPSSSGAVRSSVAATTMSCGVSPRRERSATAPSWPTDLPTLARKPSPSALSSSLSCRRSRARAASMCASHAAFAASARIVSARAAAPCRLELRLPLGRRGGLLGGGRARELLLLLSLLLAHRRRHRRRPAPGGRHCTLAPARVRPRRARPPERTAMSRCPHASGAGARRSPASPPQLQPPPSAASAAARAPRRRSQTQRASRARP